MMYTPQQSGVGRALREAAARAATVVFLTICLTIHAHAQVSPRQARVEVLISKPPTPVTVDTQDVLVYELHVTNFGTNALRLRELTVTNPAHPERPLASYGDSALRAMTMRVGAPMMMTGSTGETARIEPGCRIVVFVWLPLASAEGTPTTLRHRLLFDILDSASAASDRGTQSAIDSVMVPVLSGPVPILPTPVVGGQWVAASGPSNSSAHRRSLTAVDGHAYISQRFAIDWNMVGPNGDTHHGDEHKAESYWGFGQPIRAVAAGQVVAAVDSIADHTPHTPLPPVTVASLPGNYVTIRIGPRQYATFAHLEHGSVRVHSGQTVQAGEIIGLLGITGQSSAPHLHFQLTDGPSVLGSEGLPYVLRTYTDLGPGQEFEENKHPSIPRHHALPGDNEVIKFPR